MISILGFANDTDTLYSSFPGITVKVGLISVCAFFGGLDVFIRSVPTKCIFWNFLISSVFLSFHSGTLVPVRSVSLSE